MTLIITRVVKIMAIQIFGWLQKKNSSYRWEKYVASVNQNSTKLESFHFINLRIEKWH